MLRPLIAWILRQTFGYANHPRFVIAFCEMDHRGEDCREEGLWEDESFENKAGAGNKSFRAIMKFNTSGPSVSAAGFYQKHLFIFLTKQFENSSLINSFGRKDSGPRTAPAIAIRTAKWNWDSEIDGFSFLEFAKSTNTHKFHKRPQVKTSRCRTRISWTIITEIIVDLQISDKFY